jgi:hypothetical protein
MAKPRKRKPPKDFAILHGPTEDGQGARVLRFKAGSVYAGEVRPVREGQSIGQSEVVRLKPLGDHPAVCEVEVLHEPSAAPAADAPREAETREGDAREAKSQGPARVANDTYRRNWSTVFGPKPKQKRTRQDWSLN